MSYQLDTRESKWLVQKDLSSAIGPGSYEGALTTQNTWGRVVSRGSGIGEHRNSIYGESDARSTNNVPFNSKINRDDYERLNKQYNPGPGTYINV